MDQKTTTSKSGTEEQGSAPGLPSKVTDFMAQPEDETLVNNAVKFINEKVTETVYKGSLEIGEYILKNFFNDDFKLASSKNPKKPSSFESLCKRPDLAVHPSTLGRMVRVAAQERFLISEKFKIEKLSYTHKAELTKLENGPKKIELAQRCIKEKLSTRDLEKLVSETRKDLIVDREPAPIEAATEFVSKFDKFVKEIQLPPPVEDIEQLKSMDPRGRAGLRRKAQEFVNRGAQVEEFAKKMQTVTAEWQILIEKLDEIKGEKKKSKREEANSSGAAGVD